mmetsp:Transcript_31083/g.48690  ORF Transcript_31083/g.48690 Transcript_31083/m.48690 type:complete len:729 (-) Transcript_31083:24-2210(-)|eukprot:CAMPEP_0184288412 /NCGR_PEP_ID=MMETSP1049-20130417/922_1 /TAXON_ID=77928 /ORGANISM="Proteomonas sulcata, Strain CCMP704" /LENGTH=728 /DNA_ID=CAMNT_0026594801 /DNA_START=340 /DNA_END=2526 /DNA_ORIENTATION=-
MQSFKNTSALRVLTAQLFSSSAHKHHKLPFAALHAPRSLRTQLRRFSATSGDKAVLEYQSLPGPGLKVGRYINHTPEKEIHVDEHIPVKLDVMDARSVGGVNSIKTTGFELARGVTTQVKNFRDDSEVQKYYYQEVEEVVKHTFQAHGMKVSKVMVFDHTVRSSEATSLNTLGQKASTAASVVRVHCDYTAVSAPRRFKQLSEAPSYTGVQLTKAEVESVVETGQRYAFVNVWRNIDPQNPVMVRPLAVCDPRSIKVEDYVTYELVYDNRIGETYALPADKASDHQWYYYPQMRSDESLIFTVYDRKLEGPRFVFHTAFDDPASPEDAPPRMSIEARTIVVFDEYLSSYEPDFDALPEARGGPKIGITIESKAYSRGYSTTASNKPAGPQLRPHGRPRCYTNIGLGHKGLLCSRPLAASGLESRSYANAAKKLPYKNGESAPIFFDMVHSNNAARIRLWLRLSGMTDAVETRMVTYGDLHTDEFLAVNPLRKVPALITANGTCIFESFVIMQYVEDKLGDWTDERFVPEDPEEKALVNLLVRIHDLYIASPNCTQPNFSHNQGAMYLAPYPTEHCAKERTMDRPTRAAKIAELWKQLSWLDKQIEKRSKGQEVKFLLGEELTHADMTWFPTIVFMEYMLPKNLGWEENIFVWDGAEDLAYSKCPLPYLAKWYTTLSGRCGEAADKKYIHEFAKVRQEIWKYWELKDADGQFLPVREEAKDPSFKWVYP